MSFFDIKKAANHARLATFSAFNNSLRIIVTNIAFYRNYYCIKRYFFVYL